MTINETHHLEIAFIKWGTSRLQALSIDSFGWIKTRNLYTGDPGPTVDVRTVDFID